MIFTGEHEYTIDAKQRLAIPAEIRSHLDPERDGAAFYLVPGPNGAPWLWPEKVFEDMAGSMETSFLKPEEELEFELLMFSQATRLEIDKVGRIRLPDRVMARIKLGPTVMIVGAKDHLELHDPARWNADREQKLARQAEIMLRARRAYEERRQNERSRS